jgi:hypothetical protein
MKMPGMEENWEDFCERLQWRFSKITYEDIQYTEGREDETLTRIQVRIGKSRKELLDLFDRMKMVTQ